MNERLIAVVIHDGVQALDVAGPLDVFAEANLFTQLGHPYRCVLVATNTQPLRASNGMLIQAHLSYGDATGPFDTVLVAGGPALPARDRDSTMCEWLQLQATRAARYGSICTGTFALGHAGLLEGRRATTHWQNAGRLASMFPGARVEHDRIFSRDGALVTSAGVTAGIDLALALVNEDHGAAVALACAKRLLVVAQRQGGQSQFSSLLLPPSAPETPLSRVLAYIMEHVDERLSTGRLAEIAGISLRSLSRLFSEELATTPREFIEDVRLERARGLLEATDLALKTVAFDCGFAGGEQMRGVFQRRLGLTPQDYRRSFKRQA